MKFKFVVTFLLSCTLAQAITGRAVVLVDLSLRKEIKDTTTVGNLFKGDTVEIIGEFGNLFWVRKDSVDGWAPKFNFFVIVLQEDETFIDTSRSVENKNDDTVMLKLNDTYCFANLNWGDNVEEVEESLLIKMYIPEEMEVDSIKGFTGFIFNEEVFVYAFFDTGGKLGKLTVLFQVDNKEEIVKIYSQAKEELVKKYGPPLKEYGSSKNVAESVKDENGYFVTMWPYARDSSDIALLIIITSEDTIVGVFYESKEWKSAGNDKEKKNIPRNTVNDKVFNFISYKNLCDSYYFENLLWGTDFKEVESFLMEKYDLISKDEGLLMFGKGIDTTIFANFDKNRKLIAISVWISSIEGVISTYQEMKKILTKKFGPPAFEEKWFEFPYEEDRRSEEFALKFDKGQLRCFWLPAKDGSVLELEVISGLLPKVVVSYESKKWLARLSDL